MFRRLSHYMAAAILTLILTASAGAQTVKGLDDPDGTTGVPSLPSGDAPSQFLIEPDAAIKGNNIKQQTYRSQATGQNKNWNLDIGRFQTPINEDPNQVAEDLKDRNFSGMRFRLPLRGGTRN